MQSAGRNTLGLALLVRDSWLTNLDDNTYSWSFWVDRFSGSWKISMARKSGYSKISSVDHKEESKEVSFISALLFQWMNSIFKTGSQRPLDRDDFLPLSKENSARTWTENLLASWEKEGCRCLKSGKRPKLWKCLFKILPFNDLLVIMFGHVLHSTYHLLHPLLLGYLVSSLMSPETEKNLNFYICALGLCLMALVATIGWNQKGYRCELFGIRISSALRGMVYCKVSTISTWTFVSCFGFFLFFSMP